MSSPAAQPEDELKCEDKDANVVTVTDTFPIDGQNVENGLQRQRSRRPPPEITASGEAASYADRSNSNTTSADGAVAKILHREEHSAKTPISVEGRVTNYVKPSPETNSPAVQSSGSMSIEEGNNEESLVVVVPDRDNFVRRDRGDDIHAANIRNEVSSSQRSDIETYNAGSNDIDATDVPLESSFQGGYVSSPREVENTHQRLLPSAPDIESYNRGSDCVETSFRDATSLRGESSIRDNVKYEIYNMRGETSFPSNSNNTKMLHGGRNLKSPNHHEKVNQNEDDFDNHRYPRDSYSFMALHGPTDDFLFFSFGLMAFLFQMAFLTLMVLSVVRKDLRSGDFGEGVDNPGNPDDEHGAYEWASGFLPSNASNLVRATQITSILSFLVFADETLLDIARAIELIPLVCCGICCHKNEIPNESSTQSAHNNNAHVGHPSNNQHHWMLLVSCLLRFVQGIMAVFAVFLLVMTEDSVIDIVLNFTAVNFISKLDDTAFFLAKCGKFGPRLRREAKSIETRILPPAVRHKRVQAWYAFAIIPTSIILLGLTCGIVAYQESSSKWITNTFRVQFQDSTGIASYSGCYHMDAGPDNKIHKRYIYHSDPTNRNSSIFGYCLEKREWVFFRNYSDDLSGFDPCFADGYELAHSSVSNAFDVSTSFGDDWFSFHNTPLDMYFIEVEDVADNCGSQIRDGVCDLDFNNFFYQYDGGDCCASTCSGPSCGKMTEDNNTISFPLCEDPAMSLLKMRLYDEIPSYGRPLNDPNKTWWMQTIETVPGWEDLWTPKITLECGGIVIMETSNIKSKNMFLPDLLLIGSKQGEQNYYHDSPKYASAPNPTLNAISGSTPHTQNVTSWIDATMENCSLTTEHFDELSFELLEAPSNTNVERKVRNPIPKRIGTILKETTLNRIDLSGNDFTGTIPGEIGSNANLTTLLFDNNALTGTIPEELANLESLEKLSFSNNKLSGTFPWELLLLTKLKSLNFDHNVLTGTLPTEIALLTSLTHLSLYNNSFHGALPNEIGSMKNLKSLNLGANSFFGKIGKGITFLTNLETVDLGGNSFDGTIPVELELLTNLKELSLGGNSFDSNFTIDFGALTRLTHLDLSSNSFTGPFPISLVRSKNLRYLNLGKNSFGGDFSLDLFEFLPQMMYLDLSGNDLRTSLPITIAQMMPNLEHLDLADIDLTGTIPTEVGNLRRLTHLDLDGNNLKGPIPSEIGNLISLETLDIGQNSMTGTIPTEIGSLSRLSGLWMYYNSLQGTIPCELESLTNLSTLNLNFNYLTGPIPSRLQAEYFHVSNQLLDHLVMTETSIRSCP